MGCILGKITKDHLRKSRFACLWEYTINDEPPPNWWRWRFCSNRWCVGLLDNNAPDVEFLSQMRPRLRCVDYDDEISVFGVTQHPISGKYLLVIEPTFLLLRRYLYAPAQPKNSSKFCPLSL
ncbi:5188_t:CDS:2 [Ambispora gerdemannii]|uniref:5188_t:CDS:1 n=1 Tax=Ambispora gerdemannii TaxID=144530 RepID=A0A9N9F883_9GLOM|nr:5188_t:CDS:2 [Ambispora gerdemannii]